MLINIDYLSKATILWGSMAMSTIKFLNMAVR